MLTTISPFLLLWDINKHDKNALQNPKISASAVGLGAFGNLFYFPNCLKLVNLVPAYDRKYKKLLKQQKFSEVFSRLLGLKVA